MIIGASLLLTSSLAVADPAAVYRVPLSGDALRPAQRDALQQRLDATMRESSVALVESEPAEACSDETCWLAEAKRLDARFMLTLDVQQSETDHALKIRIVDTNDGTLVVDEARTCELCGRDELEDAASDVVARGLRRLATQVDATASLSVDSIPAGATVLLDGAEVGKTPLTLDVEVGSHTVQVSAAGYETSSETLELSGGTREGLRLRLAPSASSGPGPADMPPEGTRNRRKLWLGGGLLGGGVLAIGTGAALVVLHGRPITSDCSGDNRDADGDCHFLHDTRIGGITALSVGAAAAVAGAVVLGLELRNRRASVALSPTTQGVLLHGRF